MDWMELTRWAIIMVVEWLWCSWMARRRAASVR